VTAESFDSISSYRLNDRIALSWRHVFSLPEWLRTWWRHFGADFDLNLCAVRKKGNLLGIAPLMIDGENAIFIGSENVCDYLDFVVVSGKEQAFFETLLSHLRKQGIRQLDLTPLRSDSTVYAHLAPMARDKGYRVLCDKMDVSLEMDLPAAWDDYLHMLNGKQRHEIRRKFRRLYDAADIDYRVLSEWNDTRDRIDLFFTFFRESREDKAIFMTEQMHSFFRELMDALSKLKILKLKILELDGTPAAMALCFDYQSTVYLYNSSYNLQYQSLSVGVLCKALSIKESISNGRKRYDFLKGDEGYKHRMGGKEVPLYRCRIALR
jgi:CelD/BcsL family acetyltransferase involved in cellulose biosynthesis